MQVFHYTCNDAADCDPLLLKEMRRKLRSDGFLVLAHPIIKERTLSVADELRHLLFQLAARDNIALDPSNSTESLISELAKRDRSLVGTLYDAAGRLTSLHQLGVDDVLINLSKALLPTTCVQSALDKAIRIDLPAEDAYLFPWHQDYTYDPSSPGGLVYWIPLNDLKNPVALELSLGSHRRGIRRIRVPVAPRSKVSGAKMYEVSDADDLLPQTSIVVKLSLGQVLIFDNLLMHRSLVNRSGFARLTIQVRHGDFNNRFAIEKGWPHGSFRGIWFSETHPEFIDDEE